MLHAVSFLPAAVASQYTTDINYGTERAAGTVFMLALKKTARRLSPQVAEYSGLLL